MVCGNNGGRPQAQDLDTYMSLKEAYELQPESVVFVFNKTKNASETYKQDFVTIVAAGVGIPVARMHHVFIDEVSSFTEAHRQQLLSAIALLTPASYTQQRDITCDKKRIELTTTRMHAAVEELEKKKEELDAALLKGRKLQAKIDEPGWFSKFWSNLSTGRGTYVFLLIFSYYNN